MKPKWPNDGSAEQDRLTREHVQPAPACAERDLLERKLPSGRSHVSAQPSKGYWITTFALSNPVTLATGIARLSLK